MKFTIKKALPHLLAIVGFLIVSLLFFYPVLQGKVIFQSDIVQYTGMAKQQNDFRADFDEEPYWIDNAFGGMPSYQVGANYPNDWVKKLDKTIRFLPRPSDYLFIYFIGIYILFMALKIKPSLAFWGALAFGFSTYLIVILGVGHNAKAHAIAYMPLVISGIILTFRNNYFWGGVLLAIGMALEIVANHFQMTYYLLILVIVLGLVYLYKAFQNKTLTAYFKSIAVMVGAVVIALAANATNLLATQEYTQHSTRGSSELSIQPDGSPKAVTNGLDYNYITEYSYGIMESFNLYIPNFMGGSSTSDLGKDSNVYEELLALGASPSQALEFTEGMPTYWGDQTYVAAPAYLGAAMVFLFLMALFLVKGKHKWWIVGTSILALLLSWGDNFSILTKFFVNYVPLYNKFRAVSSIQVLIELCVPIMAILGLSKLVDTRIDKKEKWEALKWSSLILGGLTLLFLLFKSSLFNFSGAADAQLQEQLGAKFVRALKEDRKAMFSEDAIRSLLIILFIAAAIYAYLKQKISTKLTVIIIGAIAVIDLVFIDYRYVNEDDFVQAHRMEKPFQPNAADKEILKDEGHFRVLDLTNNPFNTGKASYFHNALGGYHAAKPAKIQDVFDFHITRGNQEVLNMLNVKYEIIPQENQVIAEENKSANGNAWLVNDIVWVENADEELLALGEINTKEQVVIQEKYKDLLSTTELNPTTENDFIQLKSHQPNKLVYKFKTSSPQIAVFSESYYENGWQVKLNGESVSHFKVNYLLRGMELPAGKGELVFSFEPQVVKTGSKIALTANIVLLILILGGLFFQFKNKSTKD
ncbi:MAG: YfhO family protein [Bacteroidota bacterium]